MITEKNPSVRLEIFKGAAGLHAMKADIDVFTAGQCSLRLPLKTEIWVGQAVKIKKKNDLGRQLRMSGTVIWTMKDKKKLMVGIKF